MEHLKAGIKVGALLLTFYSFSLCQDALPTKVKFSGMGFMEHGQVMKGKILTSQGLHDFGPGTINLPKTAVNFRVDVALSDRLKFVLQPEIQAWSPTLLERWVTDPLSGWRSTTKYSVLIQNANLQYALGDPAHPLLTLGLGTFLYKYNSNARNLGEYLFRSGAYPGYVINEIDFPYARLTGLRISSDLFQSLHQDIFFTREQEVYPIGDLSLSYLVRYNFGKYFEVGAGASMWRLIPSDDSSTTVRSATTAGSNTEYRYHAIPGDTTTWSYYTFSGTKLMCQVSIDLKSLFPSSFWGKEDLKVYSEAAVLGLKDYYGYEQSIEVNPIGLEDTQYIKKGFYDSLYQRIPVMFGINLPTHQFTSYCLLPGLMAYGLESVQDKKTLRAIEYGLPSIALGLFSWLIDRNYKTSTKLDLLAFNLEYYGSRFPNGYYRKKYDEKPYPIPTNSKPNDQTNNVYELGKYDYHRDDWKWSVYIKKSMMTHVSFMVQIARDHLRQRMDSPDLKVADETDLLPRPDHWYWVVKAQYGF